MRILCKEECSSDKTSLKGKSFTLLTSALVLFMPKCALCWAAYMSFLGSMGIVIKYRPWFLPVLTILFILTLIKLLIAAIKRRNFLSFGLALAAGVLIYSERTTPGIDSVKIVAIIMMATAILMDNMLKLFRLFKLNKIL
jgi:hypothetical protein